MRIEERYLGSLVNVSTPAAFKPLLEKIEAELQAWKARLLSPAGKIVLLKSVIEAVALYRMSTTLIQKSILDKIQSKCIQFFWRRANRKAICFVKWERLTIPKAQGGLGLRNIYMLNQAMVLKNIWKLVTSGDALWVQAMKAKYHPYTPFWFSNRTTNCTRLWSAMMQHREIMAANLK